MAKSANARGHVSREMSPPEPPRFVHLRRVTESDAEPGDGQATCLEIPEVFLKSRLAILGIPCGDPAVVASPAWRHHAGVSEALASYDAGDASLLGELILRVPLLLRLDDAVFGRWQGDAGRMEGTLLKSMLSVVNKRRTSGENIALHRVYDRMRKVDVRPGRENRFSVMFAPNGTPVERRTLEAYQQDSEASILWTLAKDAADAEEKGKATRGRKAKPVAKKNGGRGAVVLGKQEDPVQRHFERIKREMLRLNRKAVVLPFMTVACKQHVDAVECVLVDKRSEDWQSLDAPIPSAEAMVCAELIHFAPW